MKLQKILWPTEGLCTEEKLYLHTNVIDDDFNINRDENHLKSRFKLYQPQQSLYDAGRRLFAG